MVKRLVPERTIDSLLAHELLHAVPTGLIWSPTNSAGSYDHEFFTGNSTWLFECKGVVSNGKAHPIAPWRLPIDLQQLNQYLSAGCDLTYLLPARPRDLRVPWRRRCGIDPDPNGECLSCRPNPNDLTDSRRFANNTSLVRAAAHTVRFQPWFNHWAWCVRASDLRSFIPYKGKSKLISARDLDLGQIPNAVRLCHVLQDLSRAVEGGVSPVGESERFVLPHPALQAVLRALRNSSIDDEQTPPMALKL